MTNMPAFKTAVDRSQSVGDERNPFDDAELVLYSAESDWAEGEPKTENLDELGLVSWSLWARFEEEMTEIPIVAEASWHMWYSLSAETWSPDPAEPVSDAFIAAIAEMVDEDVGDGWGAIPEATWTETSDLEKYIIHLVQQGFLEMDAAEPALIIEWCEARYDSGTAAERGQDD